MLLENQIIQWYITLTLDFKKFDDPYILNRTSCDDYNRVFRSCKFTVIDAMLSTGKGC